MATDPSINLTIVSPFTTTTTREFGKDVSIRDYPNGDTVVRVNGSMVGKLTNGTTAWISHKDLNNVQDFDGDSSLDRKTFLSVIRLVHVY